MYIHMYILYVELYMFTVSTIYRGYPLYMFTLSTIYRACIYAHIYNHI